MATVDALKFKEQPKGDLACTYDYKTKVNIIHLGYYVILTRTVPEAYKSR